MIYLLSDNSCKWDSRCARRVLTRNFFDFNRSMILLFKRHLNFLYFLAWLMNKLLCEFANDLIVLFSVTMIITETGIHFYRNRFLCEIDLWADSGSQEYWNRRNKMFLSTKIEGARGSSSACRRARLSLIKFIILITLYLDSRTLYTDTYVRVCLVFSIPLSRCSTNGPEGGVCASRRSGPTGGRPEGAARGARSQQALRTWAHCIRILCTPYN